MPDEDPHTDGLSEKETEDADSVIDPEWWKHIFDSIYLLTDARSVCDERLTRAEADLMENFLQVGRHEPILDLCGGQGRHSLEMARRGYKHITTLDYSAYLLGLGKQSNDSRVRFVRADARSLPFDRNSYRAVAIMACSFGYFPEDYENTAVLREAYRVLTPGGILLIDIPDGEKALKQMAENTWHEAKQDVFVLRKRKPRSGGIAVCELVVSREKGLIRESNYFEKLYSASQIRSLVSAAGFRAVKVYQGLKRICKERDLGFMSSRMIVTARKYKRPAK